MNNVCNGCHDLLMMPINPIAISDIGDIAILNIKSADCRCIIFRVSKSESINLMQNTNLIQKRGTL